MDQMDWGAWVALTLIGLIFVGYTSLLNAGCRSWVRDAQDQVRSDYEAWDQWCALTDEDRAWFEGHGYSGPPDPDKQWSTGWL